jgi:hypothetical protein
VGGIDRSIIKVGGSRSLVVLFWVGSFWIRAVRDYFIKSVSSDVLVDEFNKKHSAFPSKPNGGGRSQLVGLPHDGENKPDSAFLPIQYGNLWLCVQPLPCVSSLSTQGHSFMTR